MAVSAENPDVMCFGVDNFRILDPEKKNLRIVEERISAFGVSNVRLINEDFEATLTDLDEHLGGAKVGVYFIDGPHDYRSQLMPNVSGLKLTRKCGNCYRRRKLSRRSTSHV